MHFISREEAESLALGSASSSEACLSSRRFRTLQQAHPRPRPLGGIPIGPAATASVAQRSSSGGRVTLSKREHRQPGFRLEACT
jgi:hypothetical protein